MSTLLVVLAHPHTDDFSYSLSTADKFIESYKASHPDDKVVIRDLFDEENPVPALNNTVFAAWKKQKYLKEMTEDEKNILAAHTTMLEEFLAADKYVFVNPMYNHFLTAELKQYVDLTAVTRKTFYYTENGPVGLLEGKKFLHIQAAGGYYHDEKGNALENAHDFGAPYLQSIMSLYGIKDQQGLFIEGFDNFPDRAETIKNQKYAEAEALAKTF